MDEIKFDTLHQVHPSLRKFIKQIETNGSTAAGISAGNVEVSKIASSSKDEECSDRKYANRFTLDIPYAGHTFKLEVIFSKDDLTFAPDLCFFNEDFLNEPDSDDIARLLPSLATWDASNPNALIDLLVELVKLYKAYQISLLQTEEYALLLYEYKSLVDETGMHEDDVEILVCELTKTVTFLISLTVDISNVPPQLMMNVQEHGNKNERQKSSAILVVTFQHRSDGSQIQQPQLYLADHLDQALGGGAVSKHIPPFPPHGCLVDYVPTVRKLLDDKVKYVTDNFQLKRNYIAQLLAIHTTGLLEYDSTTYSTATLLFNTDNFHWLLIITLSNNFPREKPKWVLRSVYHLVHNQLVTEVLNEYPYSPRWSPEEMIRRALKYIIQDKIESFHNKSI